MPHSSFSLVVIVLARAVIRRVIFRRSSMPPILGSLVLGVLIGPHALAFVPESADTRYLAEFGVVFLMFSIGLEFSLPQLKAMRHIVLGFGSTQVLSTMAVVMAIALLAGQCRHARLLLGGVIAMSSTAIISQMLAEQNQLRPDHRSPLLAVSS